MAKEVEVYQASVARYIQAIIDKDDYLKGKNLTIDGPLTLSVVLKGVDAASGHMTKLQAVCWPIVKSAIDRDFLPNLKKSVSHGAMKSKQPGPYITAKWKDFAKNLAPEIEKACIKYFKTFAQESRDYEYHIVKSGLLIAVNAGGLLVSGTLAGAAGWTGVGTVAAAIGITRSMAGLAHGIATLTRSAASDYDAMAAKFIRLQNSLKEESLTENTLKQLGAAALTVAIGFEIKGICETVSGLESDFATVRTKINGVKKDVTSLIGNIAALHKSSLSVQADAGKLAEERDKIHAKLRTAGGASLSKDDIARFNTLNTKINKMGEPMKQMDKAMEGGIKKVDDLSRLVDEVEKSSDMWYRRIAALNKKFNPAIVKTGTLAMQFVAAVGQVAAGDLSQPAAALHDAFKHAHNLNTVLATTTDSLSAMQTIGVSINDALGA